MRIEESSVFLSATDLANHLSCRHLTSLNLALAHGTVQAPVWDNPHAVVLQQRGLEHERAYIESLRARGLNVVELPGESESTGLQRTLEAMRSGADAIVQAGLALQRWGGRADVLLRVDRPHGPAPAWGPWSYEVVDCKLSRETKAETILQLCLYSEMVAQLQGFAPEHFHVIRPEVGFTPESYRFAAFGAYFRMVQRGLLEFIDADGSAATYPEPVSHCDVCRWWRTCDQRRRNDDHLAFVAGASKTQRAELVQQGVPTLAGLAQLPLPVPFAPTRGSRESIARLREQARIQWEGRRDGVRKHELLTAEPGQGLASLPEPARGDLFLDLEGDPFAGVGGQEYLFGVAELLDGGAVQYQHRWALNRGDERLAFEWFIDWAMAQLRSFPAMHIYHFGAYEPAALKRLMLRYATREEEVDQLLRGERFVDLHSVIKQSLRASVEQYSLKDMEPFAGYQRAVPLADASKARHWLQHELELNRLPKPADSGCQIVRGYNEDDCRATLQVRDWLEQLRATAIAEGLDIPRPETKPAEASEEVSARQARVRALFEALTAGFPADPGDYTPQQSAQWLLAHALDWHWRESKVKWWEFFNMPKLDDEALTGHKAALTGLSFVERLPKRTKGERTPIDRYRFPAQECSIKAGEKVFRPHDTVPLGEIVGINWTNRTIDLKKAQAVADLHPGALFAHTHIRPDALSGALLRLGDWVAANAIDAAGSYRAARDLLLRTPPRLAAGEPLARKPNEDTVAQACRVGVALDQSVLAIQGPPGSGKTYTGAQMICELVRQGRKVGVTAVSHAAIRGLLVKVAEEAGKAKLSTMACAHKTEADDDDAGPIRTIDKNPAALDALTTGQINVLGATAWLWSRKEFAESVDVLFVDEAGQMSLANVLACAGAGRNLVLLGDPQQLEQPQQGSHPEGSDISALAHLIGNRTTIADDQGIFLAETRRLHPAICGFTSELFYDGRLQSLQGLERQQISGSGAFDGAGLWFVPVEHEGHQSHSPEEVDCVAAIAGRLTNQGQWTDAKGHTRPLVPEDILIVAPYNDQVNRLGEALPGFRVGTVDKFQGQEAAVVIYSMATSSPEDAPRGLDFLFDPHRFNVASSRAQAACILVASPRLLSPECHTPLHMELANVLCRYVEMSRTAEARNLRRAAI